MERLYTLGVAALLMAKTPTETYRSCHTLANAARQGRLSGHCFVYGKGRGFAVSVRDMQTFLARINLASVPEWLLRSHLDYDAEEMLKKKGNGAARQRCLDKETGYAKE